jgi:hypothetical protein
MLLLLQSFTRVLETIGTKYKQTNKEGFVENFGAHPGNQLTAYNMYTLHTWDQIPSHACFLTCLLACLFVCLLACLLAYRF